MAALKSKYVLWNFDTPEGLREAILNTYFPKSCEGTDKRYQREFSALRSRSTPEQTKTSDFDVLVEILKQSGLEVRSSKHPFGFDGPKIGNYWAINIGHADTYYQNSIYLTELGKFIACDVGWISNGDSTPKEYFEGLSQEALERIQLCKAVAEGAGYVWLDADMLCQTAPGLVVWFYGEQEQCLHDLLFYRVN
jgi:hypothetical protein